MTTAAQNEIAPAAKAPFQFQIRDLLLVMLVVALSAAMIVQRSGVLFLVWLLAGAFCLALWRKRWMKGPLLVVAMLGCLGLAALLLLPGVGSRPAGPRMSCGNNLRQIVVALHNYHDVYGSFPPAYIADKSGRPMHSWRVLVLPFMEQTLLYNQLRRALGRAKQQKAA